MGTNRVTFVNQNTGQTIFDFSSTFKLPAAVGVFPLGVPASTGTSGTENDATFVPAAPVAATPYQEINLPPLAADGDEYTICDPFGALAAGTTLQINGNGNLIADGAAATASITLNAAGSCRRLMFSSAVRSGGTLNLGTWIVLNH